MPKKITKTEDRLYQKRGRWYAYVGDLPAAQARQEALKPNGEPYATKDRDLALKLLLARVDELSDPDNAPDPEPEPTGFARYVQHHLEEKARGGEVREAWLSAAQTRLERAIAFLGVGKPVAEVDVRDMADYAAWLAEQPSGRRGGGTLSAGTIRHHLNDISNLYRRAQAEGVVPPGYNPVGVMLEKPSAERKEARWLEAHEAALLLEAAHAYEPKREEMAAPLHVIVATMLLTGGRKAEVLGLAVDDVSFERQNITFRPHPWRPLKTKTSPRSVPLWPQLESVLLEYMNGPDRPRGQLLFPSHHSRVVNGRERMLTDLRRPLDEIGENAGWAAGEIRTKMFRHTYCSMRLQTVQRMLKPNFPGPLEIEDENGRRVPNPAAYDYIPVSTFTVAREMGHGGTQLVERVYGHLGRAPHRAEVVEYRPELIERIGDVAVRKAFVHRLRVVRGELAA